MPQLTHIFAITFAAFAVIAQIASIATPNFMADVSNAAMFDAIGLFYQCNGGDCSRAPSSVVPDWGVAAQVLSIIGLIGLVVGLIIGIVSLWSDRYYFVFNIIAAIIVFVAAFLVMVEFAVYSGGKNGHEEFSKDNYRLGYSFAICIAAFLLAVVSGVCFLLTLCCREEDDY